MELVSWTLNRSTFSGREDLEGGSSLLAAARRTLDPWDMWKVVRQTTINDMEDIYIFGILITDILLFGARKIQKT